MSIYNLYTEDCLSCESSGMDAKIGERFCLRIDNPNSKNCPCHICIVKSMCGDSCEDYRIYWNFVDGE